MSPVADTRFTSKSRAAHIEDVTKQEWITPLIMLGVSLAILVIVFMFYAGAVGAGIGLVAMLVQLAIQAVLGIVALWLACVALKTGVGPMGLAFLRLCAAFAVISVTGIPLSGLGCMGTILNLVVLAGLLMWMFELEGVEAVVVIILMIGVNLVAGFLLAGALSSML